MAQSAQSLVQKLQCGFDMRFVYVICMFEFGGCSLYMQVRCAICICSFGVCDLYTRFINVNTCGLHLWFLVCVFAIRPFVCGRSCLLWRLCGVRLLPPPAKSTHRKVIYSPIPTEAPTERNVYSLGSVPYQGPQGGVERHLTSPHLTSRRLTLLLFSITPLF